MTFCEQYLMLKDSYMRREGSNLDTREYVLSKIFNYCFFTNSEYFPTRTPVPLCFSDIQCDLTTLEQSLLDVFHDLNYRQCMINADSFQDLSILTVTVG